MGKGFWGMGTGWARDTPGLPATIPKDRGILIVFVFIYILLSCLYYFAFFSIRKAAINRI